MPFQVISNKAARRMKSDNGDSYRIMYINRMKAFKPAKSMLDEYEEMKRRFSGKDNPEQYGLDSIHFQDMYRHYLMKDGFRLGAMREMYNEAKGKDVYLVNESKLPITDVILDIIKSMAGVWG